MMSSFERKFDYLRIPLVDIDKATNYLVDDHIIGQGRLGKIYKGQLLMNRELIDIAARVFDYRSEGEYRYKEFQKEIMMLSSLKHQNLATIVAYCQDDDYDEEVIVIKFEARGSLDRYLSDPITLTWTQRLRICIDIARALSYIHYDEGRSFSVIHRNIKSSKVLLGDKWEAKLYGFELSTTQPASRRHGLVFDKPCGTQGYVDPVYVTSESVSHKSDVYSFGVVLFEVLSGKKALITRDKNQVLLAQLAKSSYENGQLNEIIHPGLQIDSKSLKVFSDAAYCCLNEQRSQRPNIDAVIFRLEQALNFQLAHENSLVLKEQSKPAVEAISTDYWKGKNLEHLKIELDAIKSATENFAEKYIIGKGGYGCVYKAELEHFESSSIKGNKEIELRRKRSTVAIKCIFNREDKQGEQGFFTEIETLGSCMHPNIVSLLGFCYEPPFMILVYEHVSKGSLDNYLGNEGKMTYLTWLQRIKICIDIARGLDYLHSTMDTKQNIVHRDIKSDNILLGKNWEAKIADFGLSKIHQRDHVASTINTTNVAGTPMYLDPEYEKTGKLKKESDVYSFGVVLFEILSGRLAYDPVYTKENEKGLAPIVRQHFAKGTIEEMVDPSLKEEYSLTLSKGPDQDSLNTFLLIGHRCLAEKQADRPTMKVVIEELEKALNFQETHKDSHRMSFEDIRLATQNFRYIIGKGRFAEVYKGEILRANGPTPIAVKRYGKSHRSGPGEEEDDEEIFLPEQLEENLWKEKQWDKTGVDGERNFLIEVEILFEYKHENIIGLVGYCNENNEKILVYEYASKGSLDRHFQYASLTWRERIKIGIDVANGLDFLHGSDPHVIHRDIIPANILLDGDWKAKIRGFELSMITPLNNEIDFVIDNACGLPLYFDPQYFQTGFLTKESDIYSLGVVLFEMMSGRTAYVPEDMAYLLTDKLGKFDRLVKHHYAEGKLDELVLEGIKDKIVPESLTAYQRIAYECLNNKREEQPKASEVVLQLKKALEFQEDIEIWEARLPGDYKEIIRTSKTPEIYS